MVDGIRAHMHDGPLTASELKELLDTAAPSDTYVYVLHAIDRVHKPNPVPVPNIKCYHHFHYTPDRVSLMYPQSSSMEDCYQHQFVRSV